MLFEYDWAATYSIYSSLSNPVSMSISVAFSIGFSFLSLMMVFFTIYFINRDKRFFLGMISILLTSLIVYTLKFIFARPRPLLNSVFIPIVDMVSYSFPSGHAALTATVMTLLAYFSKRYRLLAVLCVILGSFSRVIVGMHYVSDVIAGVALGILVAVVCLRFSDRILSLEPRLNRAMNSLYQKI